MRPDRLPVIRTVIDAGPEDRIFDGLLIVGPLVILLLAVLGRSTLTMGIGAVYVAAFVVYVLYLGLRTNDPR